MATLPQLIEDDIRVLDNSLREFNAQTGALVAMVIDKGGFLITSQGEAGEMDLTTLGALASGAFLASQTIAGLVNEKNFNSTFQQGENFSVLVLDIAEGGLYRNVSDIRLTACAGSPALPTICRVDPVDNPCIR